MKKTNKKVSAIWFFIVAILIIALTAVSVFGIKNYYGDTEKVYFKSASDIRWGIDIQGGVEAVFAPEGVDTDKVTATQLEAAKEVIDSRLINQGVTDYETSIDNVNKQIIVRFPWQSGDEAHDAATTVKELGQTAKLTFCSGTAYDESKIILDGSMVDTAEPVVQNGEPMVSLKLNAAGKEKFAEGTKANLNGNIAICLDGEVISAPQVKNIITDGMATISGGNMDSEYCTYLANTINAGVLPFAMNVDDSKLQVISATLGEDALNAMLIAAIIAFAIVSLIIIVRYRLPGAVAVIALIGQIGGMIACSSGFFGGASGFTLTIPGIAGMILSIGMGVDANVITAERITEEIRSGKTVTRAIDLGSSNSFSAIADGNVTNILVTIVLMGCFGPSDNIFAKLFSPIISWFGASVSGAVYSFGYTLLIGVIFNFIMGVYASKLMLKSISSFKCMRNPWLYGGAKNAE